MNPVFQVHGLMKQQVQLSDDKRFFLSCSRPESANPLMKGMVTAYDIFYSSGALVLWDLEYSFFFFFFFY